MATNKGHLKLQIIINMKHPKKLRHLIPHKFVRIFKNKIVMKGKMIIWSINR